MDRRKSIKTFLVGTVSAGVLLDACKEHDTKVPAENSSTGANSAGNLDRTKEEIEEYRKIISDTFFTAHEIATITILGDIIIPKDKISGSASDGKVPEFIEFIVKDMPKHQVPMRGGLRWLDVQCLKSFEKAFKDCSRKQQMEMIDEIAWPNKARPEMKQGVAFFNLVRNLTATGFYTSEIGVKDIGYEGNKPSQWNGVPDDVLKQYNLAYTEKELKEYAGFDKI